MAYDKFRHILILLTSKYFLILFFLDIVKSEFFLLTEYFQNIFASIVNSIISSSEYIFCMTRMILKTLEHFRGTRIWPIFLNARTTFKTKQTNCVLLTLSSMFQKTLVR